MNDTVEQIKERLSIEEIIKPYVKLVRAGKSLRGLCPFHKEKTPSFHVSLERSTFHCFGCGAGGDGFTFIEKIEGVDFKGALKILAEKAGVTLQSRGKQDTEVSTKRERLRSAMSEASEWYAKRMSESPAEAYAVKRGLLPDTILRARLGYAPASWRELLEVLVGRGFTVSELLLAGLIKEADGRPGTYYDRFRDRLMFPIRDIAGRVIAFTGRALSSNDNAKYLNSPETDLYHKSDILYGIYEAKDAMRVRGYTLLVEGQMDALLASQAGFQNVVALSGTALSQKHLALLKRYSENLLLAFDADTAGLSATIASAKIALSQGFRVKVARIPDGQDPADMIIKDVSAFKESVANAKHIVEFLISECSNNEKSVHTIIRKAEMTILPIVAAIQSPMEREHFIEMTARSLGLSTESVRASMRKISVQVQNNNATKHVEIKMEGQSVHHSLIKKHSILLCAAVFAYQNTPLAKRIKQEYLRIVEADELPKEALTDAALFEAERVFGEDPNETAADELLAAFEQAVIREAHHEAVTKLRQAEVQGNVCRITEAQDACAKLAARLARF